MLNFKVKCPTCGKTVMDTDFGCDDSYRKEFLISGMCPECQDEVFGPRDEE